MNPVSVNNAYPSRGECATSHSTPSLNAVTGLCKGPPQVAGAVVDGGVVRKHTKPLVNKSCGYATSERYSFRMVISGTKGRGEIY